MIRAILREIWAGQQVADLENSRRNFGRVADAQSYSETVPEMHPSARYRR